MSAEKFPQPKRESVSDSDADMELLARVLGETSASEMCTLTGAERTDGIPYEQRSPQPVHPVYHTARPLHTPAPASGVPRPDDAYTPPPPKTL